MLMHPENDTAACRTETRTMLMHPENDTAACGTETRTMVMHPENDTAACRTMTTTRPKYYFYPKYNNDQALNGIPSLAKPHGYPSDTIQVDYLKTLNGPQHHTEYYGNPNLVVRRGQPFSLQLNIKLPFVVKRDRLELFFSTGKQPKAAKNSQIKVSVKEKASSQSGQNGYHSWPGHVVSVAPSGGRTAVTVSVQPSAEAFIGKYKLKVRLFSGQDDDVIERDEEQEVIVLFNAWCKDDQVYLDSEAERQEYVMNETGRVFQTSCKGKPHAKPWVFGQFGKRILEAALHLLSKSSLAASSYGNATSICRAMSAMTNYAGKGDAGLLVGNWDAVIVGGTHPCCWNGSVAILEEYMRTKRPVSYGQCWVFSGVMTTLCRTLGIPTRSVTNYESGHDKDVSLTIDHVFDEKTLKEISKESDSIWNFHVWNESWFKRPDLPDGYDGWQAFDATPQEASGGTYQCGPASVNAIKKGTVYLPYDTTFLFGEVNGDELNWLKKSTGELELTQIDKNQVGVCILTKAVGTSEAVNILNNYKYAEGTNDERLAVERAEQYSQKKSKVDYMLREVINDVSIDHEAAFLNNGDLKLLINLENQSKGERTVKLRIISYAAYYTGLTSDEVTDDTVILQMVPGQVKQEAWFLKAAEYLNCIDMDANLQMLVTARVEETGQVYTKKASFFLDKPELILTVSNKTPRIGEKFYVEISLTNPLSTKLTHGILSLEGPGIQKDFKKHIHYAIKPEGEMTERIELKSKYPGKREIIAMFRSRQLVGIYGAAEVTVQA